MEKILIGFTGKKQSGKSTCCYYLVQEYGFTLVNFADTLKIACNNIFQFPDLTEAAKEVIQECRVTNKNLRKALNELNVDIDQVSQLFTEIFEEFNHKTNKTSSDYLISPRKAYQLMGTEIGRAIDKDFWVKRINLKNDRTVISDCRFDNEAKHIMNNGGLICLVTNSRLNTDSDSHASEKGINSKYINHTIANDHCFDTLEINLDNWLSSLGINKDNRNKDQ